MVNNRQAFMGYDNSLNGIKGILVFLSPLGEFFITVLSC